MFRCFVETSKRKSSISSLHPKQMLEISTLFAGDFVEAAGEVWGHQIQSVLQQNLTGSKELIFVSNSQLNALNALEC